MAISPLWKKILLVLLVFGMIGIAVFVTLDHGTPNQKVSITNLTDCTPDINKRVVTQISGAMYGLVEKADNYNHRQTLPKYTALVRDGSCKTSPVEADVLGSTMILDIREARQSWTITFDWVKSSTVINTDLGTISPSCLPATKLPYGDFNCDKVLSLINYGTDKYDPILKYTPYTGSSFELSYDPETKTIAATILVPQEQANNTALIDNVKTAVPIWLQNKGLDPSSYTINYRVAAQ
jgi:hypothetical protein